MAILYINYTTDYGTAPSQMSVSIEDEGTFTFTDEYLPTLTADGYQFDGWMLDGRLVRAGDISNVISIDTTFELIAHWTQEKNYWGNASGGFGFPKSLVIVDENGNELTGVVTDEEVVVFDATPADVRINKTFASANGIQTGENTITYRTSEGFESILPGADFCLTGLDVYNEYNYTKLQCVISKYISSNDKTAAEKIVLNDNVYNVGSSAVISTITKNATTKVIDFNITNDTDDIYIIYFFTYAQEVI